MIIVLGKNKYQIDGVVDGKTFMRPIFGGLAYWPGYKTETCRLDAIIDPPCGYEPIGFYGGENEN